MSSKVDYTASKKIRTQAKGGDVMADLLAALALLTFAGVVGLVVMVIALYSVSAALDAMRKRKEDKE